MPIESRAVQIDNPGMQDAEAAERYETNAALVAVFGKAITSQRRITIHPSQILLRSLRSGTFGLHPWGLAGVMCALGVKSVGATFFSGLGADFVFHAYQIPRPPRRRGDHKPNAWVMFQTRTGAGRGTLMDWDNSLHHCIVPNWKTWRAATDKDVALLDTYTLKAALTRAGRAYGV